MVSEHWSRNSNPSVRLLRGPASRAKFTCSHHGTLIDLIYKVREKRFMNLRE